MNVEQAIQIINQAIDLSLANGTFKTSNDVVVIAKALETLKETFSNEPLATKKMENKK